MELQHRAAMSSVGAMERMDKAKVIDAACHVGKEGADPGCAGAVLTKALSEMEDNKLVYEVSLKHKGTNYDIIVTPEGTITLVEKAIDAKSLPKAVSDALDKKYPKAKIKLAEELSDGTGKVTAYEVHITTADNKEVAVEFEPNGKIVGEE